MTAEKAPSVPRVTCGSYAGYQAHRKHDEIVCDFCKAARNAWEKGRRAARTTATERARLTPDERAHLDSAAWMSPTAVATYVEDLIADRLLRYTTHAPEPTPKPTEYEEH